MIVMKSQKILICTSPSAELSPEESLKVVQRAIMQKRQISEVKNQLICSKIAYEKKLSEKRAEIRYTVVQKDGTMKHRKAVTRIIEEDKKKIEELMAKGMTYREAIDFIDNTRQVFEPTIEQKDEFSGFRWKHGKLTKQRIISYPALYLTLKKERIYVGKKLRAKKGDFMNKLAKLEGVKL